MKKTILVLTVIISLIIINNLIRSIYNLWQKQTLVVKTEKELTQQKKVNTSLQRQYAEVKDSSYVEKIARDKLFMGKPGEAVVVLPYDAPLPQDDTNQEKQRQKEEKTPLQQWLALFAF